MKIFNKITLVVFLLIVGLFIVRIGLEEPIYSLPQNRTPNYKVNGEEVFCGVMSRNVFDTGIRLYNCDNGKKYYNVQDLEQLS